MDNENKAKNGVSKKKPSGKWDTGRPTKYKKKYCKQLLNHMKDGLSFESFGGVVGVAKDTLYQWIHAQQDFADSKKRGDLLTMLFWEKMGIAGAAGKLPNFNSGCWIFNMKNRTGWKDKTEVEHKDSSITLNYKDA